ncbi:MAG TPA: hypothetical protein VMF64_03400 [Steroidobacteraceae bacterium]|nr:hypothetical protein [Steroidobacteraceae bacterium]
MNPTASRSYVARYTLTCGVALLWAFARVHAGQPEAPQVSRFLARDLKAAQDDLNDQNYPKALTLLQHAQAARGQRTAWDEYVIDVLSFKAYAGEHDMQDAAPMLLAAAHSQYASAGEQKSWLRAIIGTYQSEKQHQKVISIGQDYLTRSGFDTDIATMVAVSQQAVGRDRDAAETVQTIINREAIPQERYLLFQWQLYTKLDDHPHTTRVIDELVQYYPKPDYWLNVLQPLLRAQISDAHLQLDVYRLMHEVGALTMPGDYAELAELAYDAGYPAETVAVLRQAFAQHVFADQRDALRYQHLLIGAQRKAQADRASLPAQEIKAAASSTGDQLVAVGAAYLSYGEADKGAQLIQQGIVKGNLRNPEQASLLLGVALLRSHQPLEARKSFESVAKSPNDGYAQLGHLWILHSEARGAV